MCWRKAFPIQLGLFIMYFFVTLGLYLHVFFINDYTSNDIGLNDGLMIVVIVLDIASLLETCL